MFKDSACLCARLYIVTQSNAKFRRHLHPMSAMADRPTFPTIKLNDLHASDDEDTDPASE
jgi:hypothetical protein